MKSLLDKLHCRKHILLQDLHPAVGEIVMHYGSEVSGTDTEWEVLNTTDKWMRIKSVDSDIHHTFDYDILNPQWRYK